MTKIEASPLAELLESEKQYPRDVYALSNLAVQEMSPEQLGFYIQARNAIPEITELVGLCRKITDRGRTVSEADVDRIREIVGGEG